MRRAMAMATLLVAATAGPLQAQTRGGRPASPGAGTQPVVERVRILFDAGASIVPGSFGQDFTLTRNAEDAPVSTNLTMGTSVFFDGGARIRVGRRVSIGAVGYLASGSADGTLDAQVPHPFYFGQPRDVAGNVSGLARREIGAHMELVLPVSVSPRFEIMAFGGPSYIHLEQDLVTDLTYSEAYPYDTATFRSATTTTASKGAFGFNVGADLTWRLGRSLRGGALVRYSQADVTLPAASGNDATVRAGGLQVGAGLRILIRKHAPPTRRPAPPPPRRR
jgi:hypothetical protein